MACSLCLDEVKEELDVIFSLLNQKKHLVILDCKAINYPSQMSESALTPIVVYIKIIPKVGQIFISLSHEISTVGIKKRVRMDNGPLVVKRGLDALGFTRVSRQL